MGERTCSRKYALQNGQFISGKWVRSIDVQRKKDSKSTHIGHESFEMYMWVWEGHCRGGNSRAKARHGRKMGKLSGPLCQQY